MIQTAETTIMGQNLVLHPFAAAYWQEKNTLLMADLHLGKVSHFRKHGAAVPADAAGVNWEKLIHLFLEFSPARVLFLGDLFHSSYNREWEDLRLLTRRFEAVQFNLIPGNHDILPAHLLQEAGIQLLQEEVKEDPFLFSHHPLTEWSQEAYNLAGHIHPGVRLTGPGKQYMRFPCFHFGKKQGLLPAFGAFTGLGMIQPQEGDRVFVLSEEKVIGPLAV